MPGKVTEIFFKEGCSEDFLISAKQNIPESEYIKKAVTNFVTAFFMSLRKQRGNMDQRKKEPPVCANSADTGGFYTNLQIYFISVH